ncbi:MAG: hypothetical protein A2075_12900 [Geobacteraceae bacterium GWC2_58_44]|nr:MAG: hypothetical protein A2075_12900 [Geobacteraceae bacterium GWC2_58_44]HBG05584.1 hypothetical protein [Geobacter sp.]
MCALACNIVSYRPDPDLLAANFRPWHVEALLYQAATLMDRCLVDFREYSSLDYEWNQFKTDLEVQEKQLDLDKIGEAEGEAEIEAEGVADKEVVSAQDEAVSSEESQEGVEENAEVTEAEPALALAAAPIVKSTLQLRAEAVQRKKELAGPGRPFALDEQRDLTLKRVCRDYEEGLNRACVAYEGLKTIFGLVGLASPLRPESETLATSITQLSIWIRNAIEWLVEYQHLEQAFTRVVSVRSLLNRSAWVQLKQARDSFSTKLQVPADLFRGYDNCRLRGIGASLIGEAGKVPWSIVLRLPDDAVYERSGQMVDVDQSSRAFCLLGRVENRRSVHPVEICGETTLLNASPVGRPNPPASWSLEIFKPAGATSESFGHVEDVVLEIQVSGYPRTSTS